MIHNVKKIQVTEMDLHKGTIWTTLLQSDLISPSIDLHV